MQHFSIEILYFHNSLSPEGNQMRHHPSSQAQDQIKFPSDHNTDTVDYPSQRKQRAT
jgi:hypothetical protein